MPQLISTLIFGLSFVSEKHAANELGWIQSDGWVVNRRNLRTPSEVIKSDTCLAGRLPNPTPINREAYCPAIWHERYRMRPALAAMIVVAAGAFIDPAKADQRWCAISNQGASNCSFITIEQCRAEVPGLDGYCMPEAPVGHRQPTRASVETARKAGRSS
jgi:hypothetical protein